MRFNKLEVPYQWKDYFTKYPHGFTIWEALCSWTKQVDDMVVNQNQWNDYLDNFIDNFHFELKSEVTATLEAWQSDGTLDDIITDALLSQVTKVANKIDRQHIDVTDPPGDLIPAKGDGITNDAPAIQAIINYADHGDKLFFPNKIYSCDQPIIIDKAVTLEGNNPGGDNWGSKLVFNNSSGLVFNIGQVIVQGLAIMGNDKLNKDIINIDNHQFGNVGLRFNYDDTHAPSNGVKVERCIIKNFNVGVVLYNTITSGVIWSGAYREFKNNSINYNDIGVLALNGVTFDRFLGGTISKNFVHGIYMKARPEGHLNHLSFTGVGIEANGPILQFLDNPDHVDYGVMVGENSTANFDKCYFEQITVFADKGGKIVIDKSHISAKLFGRGAINVDNGPGPYKNVFKYTVDLPTRVTPGNDEVITVGDIWTPSFDVTIDKLGRSYVYLPSTTPRGLKAGNLKYLKVSCQYEILSGFGNPYFGVSPHFSINTRGTSRDSQNMLLSYPPAAIQPSPESGVLQNIEMYYHPRVMTGYLDPNEYINAIEASIVFSNYKYDEDDFRSTPVSVRVYNPVVTLYSDIELSVNPDIWYINKKIV